MSGLKTADRNPAALCVGLTTLLVTPAAPQEMKSQFGPNHAKRSRLKVDNPTVYPIVLKIKFIYFW